MNDDLRKWLDFADANGLDARTGKPKAAGVGRTNPNQNWDNTFNRPPQGQTSFSTDRIGSNPNPVARGPQLPATQGSRAVGEPTGVNGRPIYSPDEISGPRPAPQLGGPGGSAPGGPPTLDNSGTGRPALQRPTGGMRALGAPEAEVAAGSSLAGHPALRALGPLGAFLATALAPGNRGDEAGNEREYLQGVKSGALDPITGEPKKAASPAEDLRANPGDDAGAKPVPRPGRKPAQDAPVPTPSKKPAAPAARKAPAQSSGPDGQDIADTLTKMYNPQVFRDETGVSEKFAKGGPVKKKPAPRKAPIKAAAGGSTVKAGKTSLDFAAPPHTPKPRLNPRLPTTAPKFAKGGDVSKGKEMADFLPHKKLNLKATSDVGTGTSAGMKSAPKVGGPKRVASMLSDQSNVGKGPSAGIKSAPKTASAKKNLDMGKGLSKIGGSGASVGIKSAPKKGR